MEYCEAGNISGLKGFLDAQAELPRLPLLQEATRRRNYSLMQFLAENYCFYLNVKDAAGKFPVEYALGDLKALGILRWREATEEVCLRLMQGADLFQLDELIEASPRCRRLLQRLDLWRYFLTHCTSLTIDFVLYFEARIPNYLLQPVLAKLVQYKRMQKY